MDVHVLNRFFFLKVIRLGYCIFNKMTTTVLHIYDLLKFTILYFRKIILKHEIEIVTTHEKTCKIK